MKLVLVVLLVLYHTSGFTQVKPSASHLADKIVRNFNTMRSYEEEYQTNESDALADSVLKYSDLLEKAFSGKSIGGLSESQIRSIEQRTEISIRSSPDKRMKIISWSYFVYEQKHVCSNIVCIDGKYAKDISNIAGEPDNCVQFDSIINFKLNGKVFYGLLGTGKCGRLLIRNAIAAYSVSDNLELKPVKVFFDGKEYKQVVLFDYLINEGTKSEPSLKIIKSELVCPVMDEEMLNVVGTISYQIKWNGK